MAERGKIEDAIPTIVQLVGIVLGIILVLAPIVGEVSVEQVAGGYPLATGMIFYKVVKGGQHA